MSRIILMILTMVIVQVILNIISEKAKTTETGTIYDCSLTPTKGISYLGIFFEAFALLLVILAIALGQFNGGTAIALTCFVLAGVFVSLASVKGYWETTIKDNDIKSSRLWLFKTNIKVSDISYCQQGKGSIHIFIKDRPKKVMSIDNLCDNIRLFERRMEEEGIEIRPYSMG